MSRTEPKIVRPSIIPPLESGDHLTRDEFERRYDATPNIKKAELINGVVFMPPPVSAERHGEPHHHLAGWLWNYRVATPGVRSGIDASVRMLEDSMPQPDLFLLIDPLRGGQSRLSSTGGYLEGAPELVCEVAASSAGIDLHDKLEMYQLAGVREYIVWRTLEGAIDYFVLRGGTFVPHSADNGGCLRSEAFPGLWLNRDAILRDDLAEFVKTMQAGLASPEHAAFVARLKP
jgi:Uma2 family endonuclease